MDTHTCDNDDKECPYCYQPVCPTCDVKCYSCDIVKHIDCGEYYCEHKYCGIFHFCKCDEEIKTSPNCKGGKFNRKDYYDHLYEYDWICAL